MSRCYPHGQPFSKWRIEHLSPAQRQKAEAVFSEDSQTSASLAAIEARAEEVSHLPTLRHPKSRLAREGTRHAVNSDILREFIELIVAEDIVLISDGHRAWPFCAPAIDVRYEALNLSIGERVRNAFYI